jgi:hypothetical protein
MGLVRQAFEGCGFVGAVAFGFEGLGLGRCDQSAHTRLGPDEVHDDNEPKECEEDQLREKKQRHHGIAPSNRC